MMISIDELTTDDYLILKYISKFDSVSKDQLLNKFANKIDSIEYRIELLSEPEYKEIPYSKVPINNSSYIVKEFNEEKRINGAAYVTGNNCFHITPLGKKTLKDYETKIKFARKNLLLTNIYIPIIVAFATTILTNYLIPLLSKILEWLSDIF